MGAELSPRLTAIVDALPLQDGMRVLEIGCGPGAAAREIARRVGRGHVLAIDRSAKAIAQAKAASRAEIASGALSFRLAAIEDFTGPLNRGRSSPDETRKRPGLSRGVSTERSFRRA